MNLAQQITFAVVMLSLWLGLHFYLYTRAATLVHPSGAIRLLLPLTLLGLALAFPLGRALARLADLEGPGRMLETLGTGWMGFVVMLGTLFLTLELAGLVLWLIEKLGPWTFTSPWTRLAALGAVKGRLILGAITLGVVGLMIWGGFQAMGPPRVTRVQDPFGPGTESGPGLRLVQISDVHLGEATLESTWRRTLETVAELKPDLLLITGDLIEDSSSRTRELLQLMDSMVPNIPRYGVLGNHELYAGKDQSLRLLEGARVRLLRQAGLELAPGLWLGGIDDPHFTPTDKALGELGTRIPTSADLILMSHRPGPARALNREGRSLVLAGHVHGGQLPPLQLFSPLANKGFLSGTYDLGKTRLQLSNGTGTWGPPVRIFAAPEIVVVDLPGKKSHKTRPHDGMILPPPEEDKCPGS